MSIKIHSWTLHNNIKSAINLLCKSAIRDLDKSEELFICKRGFELETGKGEKIQVILEIKEVKQ